MEVVAMPTETVPSGPFDREPVELGRALSDGFSGAVDGDEVVRRCERWLDRVLDDAGVERGRADAQVVALLAADGWSVAQVVAGWVVRAAGPSGRRAPAESGVETAHGEGRG